MVLVKALRSGLLGKIVSTGKLTRSPLIFFRPFYDLLCQSMSSGKSAQNMALVLEYLSRQNTR